MPQNKEDTKGKGSQNKESKDLFRTLFNSFEDAVFIHDLKGNFLEVNQAAYKKLGYTKKELLGMSVMDLDAPEYASKVKEKIKELQKKGSASFESTHLTKKGKRIPIKLKSRIIDFKGAKSVLSIARDISEKKNIQEERDKESQRFRSFFENAGDAILIADPKDRSVVACNQQAVKLTGFPKKELLGKKIAELHPPEIRKDILKKFKSQVKEKNKIIESRILTKKRGEVPVSISASLGKYGDSQELIGIFRDISEKKKTEQALEANEKKYRAYVDKAPLGIFITNKKGEYLEVNKKACQQIACSEKQLLQMNIMDVVSERSRETTEKTFKQLIKEGELELELEFQKKNGDKFIGQLLAVKLNEDRFIGFVRDISQQKEAEKQLKKKVGEVEKINKLLTGRELKMIEIKEEIKELKQKLGEKNKYKK